MGRGLPCVATAVGGIPELVDPPWLVPARDPDALAVALSRITRDSKAYESASRVNIDRVQTLLDTDPQATRDRFLERLLPSAGSQT
jgi:glycosyltransferase involved in cell wall biosynthesis